MCTRKFDFKSILKHKFFTRKTPVSLSEIQDINFDSKTDVNSRIPHMSMIVFKNYLPVFTAVTAVQNTDQSINITWNTENENNIDNYIVEKSKDGVNFIEIGSQIPTANNFGNPYYIFYDIANIKEVNYYRIKGNGINQNFIYSNAAKVLPLEDKNNKSINVYPNSVTNGNININFQAAILRNYIINVTRFTWQFITSKTFNHQNIGESYTMKVLNAVGGLYTATILDEKGIKKIIPFLIK